MAKSHRDAIAQFKALGEVSDANIVHYFLPELLLIGEGQKATALLPHSVRRNLSRIGILEYVKGPHGHKLTEKAKVFLRVST